MACSSETTRRRLGASCSIASTASRARRIHSQADSRKMNITGYAPIGIGASNPVNRDSQNRQLAGDLTWSHGKHSIKSGASILKSQNNILNARNEVGGPYQFNNRYTRDGMADF